MLWLYSPETMMKASAALIRPASRSSTSGACPGAYSLYILSSSGSRSSAGSTRVAAVAPRRALVDDEPRRLDPLAVVRTEP